jgi:hypothetical protein
VPLLLFAMILAFNLLVVQATLLSPIHFLFSLHLPSHLLLGGGLLVVAWLLAE